MPDARRTVCPACGEVFARSVRNRVYCCDECRDIGQFLRRLEDAIRRRLLRAIRDCGTKTERTEKSAPAPKKRGRPRKKDVA